MSEQGRSKQKAQSEPDKGRPSARVSARRRAQASIAEAAAQWSKPDGEDGGPVFDEESAARGKKSETSHCPHEGAEASCADESSAGGRCAAVAEVRMPEELPLAKKPLEPARQRVLWERQRHEMMRGRPGAMAFYEEALARFAQEGGLERLGKTNGLSEQQVRRLWERFLENHQERVTRQALGKRIDVLEPEATGAGGGDTQPNAGKTEGFDEAVSEIGQIEAGEDNVQKHETDTGKDMNEDDKQSAPAGLNKQSRAEIERVISEEIGRREFERCLKARQELAAEENGRRLRPTKRFVQALRMSAAGTAWAIAGVALAAALYASAVRLISGEGGFAAGIDRFFSSRPIAVVDRLAVRSVIADLARTETLSTVMAASEIFDELFLAAAANVASERAATLLDAKAVIAAPGAPVAEPDWEELLRSRVREASRLGLFRDEQKKMREKLRRHARTPVSLGLAPAQKARTRRIEILDERAVSKLSESVRSVLSGFARGYVFFDAGAQGQRAYVKRLLRQDAAIRPVAAAGDIQAASREMGVRLFADQGGSLMRRFELAALPSVVRLVFDGETVGALVIEVPVDENGRPLADERPDALLETRPPASHEADSQPLLNTKRK